MAGHKQHDYHIIEPSPWPLLAAIGVFTMLFGAVIWMDARGEMPFSGSPWGFWIGFGVVIYAAFVWWSDVVKEAHAGDHTPVVKIGLRYGMLLFIMSEVMFFGAWFWMYIKHWMYPMVGEYNPEGAWPPPGIEIIDPWHLPLLNTLILLTSGAAATWAHHAIMENDRKGLVNGLLLAIVLGILFTAVQAYEYYEIFHYDWFGETGNIYMSSFIAATGFHGLHVLIGTIFLLVCLLRALRGHFSPEAHIGFEAAAWYWHFVDVVWLFLFALIYVGVVWAPTG